jgi:hypothetical protein
MKSYHMLFLIALLITAPAWGQRNQLQIHFSVNYVTSPEVVRGMPLILQISPYSTLGLSKADLLSDVPDSLLLDSVFMAIIDSVYAPIVLSATGTFWHTSAVIKAEPFGQKRNFKLTTHVLNPSPKDTNQYKPDEPLHLYLGIDPDDTKEWNNGTIKLTAGLPMIHRHDTLWSAPVLLKVSNQVLKKGSAGSHSQLLEIGRYWIRRGDCDKANTIATQLYKQDSTQFTHLMLLAQAKECLGRDEEALRLMKKGMSLYTPPVRGHSEEPIMLWMKIDALQQKMNRKN